MPSRMTCVLVITGAMFACSDRSFPEPDMAVRDSAGVRIVEYGGEAGAQGTISLSTEPHLEFGLNDDEYAFQRIWIGVLLPDGAALIADARGRELVRVTPDGAFSIFAPVGQGPGEVGQVMSVLVLGPDSVLVEDDGNGRLTLFADGSPVRTTSMRGDPMLSFGLRGYGVDALGRVLMGTSSYRPGFDVPWLPGSLVRFDPTAERLDTLASYDMAPRVSGPPYHPFMPFGHVSASVGRFVVARSDVPELRWIGSNGSVEQIVRWNPVIGFPSGDAWVLFSDQLRTDLAEVNPQMGGESLDQFIEDQLSQYEVDSSRPLPLFSAIHADSEGRVWLGAYSPKGPRRPIPKYSVLGSDGTWLGTLQTPPSFRLLDARGDKVLGVQETALGVEYVVAYRLLAS